MFDIAWSEMVLIGAVALVVIGPKDLPKALRAVGEAVGKIKRMAAEFQGQFNDAMREAELHDLKKQVEDIGGSVQAATKVDFNPIQTIREELKGSSVAAGAAAGAVAAPLALQTDVAAAAPVPETPPPMAEPNLPLPPMPDPIDMAAFQPPQPEPAIMPPPAPSPAKSANGAGGGTA